MRTIGIPKTRAIGIPKTRAAKVTPEIRRMILEREGTLEEF